MGLKHTVVTSVNRDELPDGGSHHFAETIHWLRTLLPETIIEVLTPDFLGNKTNIQTVVDAKPHVYNHNIETVPRLYRQVRPQARYARSLQLLQYVKAADPAIYTKSGLMVGLGETKEEVVALLEDLKAYDVDAVTIGQYLKPARTTWTWWSMSTRMSSRSTKRSARRWAFCSSPPALSSGPRTTPRSSATSSWR